MFNFNSSKIEKLDARVQRLTEDNEELLTNNKLLKNNLQFYINKSVELEETNKQTEKHYREQYEALREENRVLNLELDDLTAKLIKSEDRVKTLNQRLKVMETGAVSKVRKPSILKE